MDLHLPLTVPGSNLKEKHYNLNLLVNEAYSKNISLQDVLHQQESSPIDRIFKIDLASKYKNIEYVMENLKNYDMLYVSRALKCNWILESEYSGKINPIYLENSLYPTMIKPAVNKMKHFIQLGLKDKKRCEEFYSYYRENWDCAFPFFWHCSNEFIMNEFPNVVEKLSHKQLKILVEVCPTTCNLYFDILPYNNKALITYVKNAQKYFNCIKNLLKFDGNAFLDIVEKYYDTNLFNDFGPSITDYIMKNCRNRFDAKSELYVIYILHIKTVAANMTSEQAMKLVIKLARAEYLEYRFSYKKVEPLIKRIKVDERAAFKKKIFVDKMIDVKVKEWPYEIPKGLVLNNDETEDIFTDIQHEPYEYDDNPIQPYGRCSIMKQCAMALRCGSYNIENCCDITTGKSPLDQLFNRYRFIGYEQTFYELSKNLLAESTIEGRLNMMLVLVSKSGGIPHQVEKLMKLLVERHRNESTILRAAVIRSLVKRGSVWRLPEEIWSLLLQFGVDIGLDGVETDPICREGLHAVILRHILADTPVPSTLLAGFVREFSTFSGYKLNIEEKKIVIKRLPLLILTVDANSFLDTIIEYKVDLKHVPNAEDALLKAARTDSGIVARLYKARILRRELFHETFALKQNNAAYMNALRHDLTPLENGKSYASFAKKERPNHDCYLKSLYIYFGEPGGLAEKHRIALEQAFLSQPKQWFARSLSSLVTDEKLIQYILDIESERPLSKPQLLMSTGLRANAHMSKPPVNVDAFDWNWLGAKTVANKAFICKSNEREQYIKKLLESRRTAKIAVRLSDKTSLCTDTFIALCTLRPLAALNLGFSLYLAKDNIEIPLWDAIKSIIQNKDLSENKRLLNKLSNPKSISKNVEGDYWVQLFNIFMKIDDKQAMPMLCRLENLLYEVDQNFVREVIKKFIDTGDFDSTNIKCLYVRVVAKHLLLCKTENEQKEAIEKVCEPFFDAIEVLLKTSESKKALTEILNDFIFALKFSKAFLSDQYVNCMPVFEAILKRMHKILPIVEYFTTYAELYLTMLYYKTIKQVEKQKSGIFDDAKKRKDTIELVGRIFGNYIGHEIKELIIKYFRSVVDLYKVPLKTYLRNYFHFNESRHHLVTFVVKGLLEVGTTEAYILAEYIFQNEQDYHMSKTHYEEILKVLKDCQEEEVKVFLYADVIAVPCA